MKLKRLEIILCDACLEGRGQECHTPGCALFLHDSPGFPIAPELYTVLEQWDLDIAPKGLRQQSLADEPICSVCHRTMVLTTDTVMGRPNAHVYMCPHQECYGSVGYMTILTAVPEKVG